MSAGFAFDKSCSKRGIHLKESFRKLIAFSHFESLSPTRHPKPSCGTPAALSNDVPSTGHKEILVKSFPHPRLTRLAAALALATTAAGANAATTWYVATNGNDASPGTLAAPWKTINHAAQVATAGDTVDVRTGTYKEYVTVANSGSASAGYITFQNYAGESPIVDGTGVSCCGGNGSIRGLFNILGKSYVKVSGFEIRNFKSTTNTNEPAGIYVTGSGSYIQILNNKVHDIVTTAEGNNGNAHGIGIYGTAATPYSYVTLSGNEVYNNKTGWSETITLDGNVTNFTVTNNVVHDNDNIGIDAAGWWGMGPSGHDQTMIGTISGNTVYNITSVNNAAYAGSMGADAIYCDGCTQVTIERNLVHDADIGIEAASEISGHVASAVTIRDNLVYDTGLVDITIGGYDSTVGGSDSITVVDNTLYQSASAQGNGFQVQYKATNNVFKNNVVYISNGGSFLYYFTSLKTAPVAMDYNLYYATTNPSWVWKNKGYSSLSSFTSASAQDAHSKYADPLFLNLAGHDFHVLGNSPAVGAGTNLGSAIVGATDYAGNPRVVGAIDIGGYEQ